MRKKLAIIGSGIATFYLLKRLLEEERLLLHLRIDVYEANDEVAVGMPYSTKWNNEYHRLNIACAELPNFLDNPLTWLQNQSDLTLESYLIERSAIGPNTVMPRVLFGRFLHDQWSALMSRLAEASIEMHIFLRTPVHDISCSGSIARVVMTDGRSRTYDGVVVATGHVWPNEKQELPQTHYMSPYPLRKLDFSLDFPVGIIGSSLTAFDAIQTLAMSNGTFSHASPGILRYIPHGGTKNFKMVMYSRRGLLPSIRYHLEHPQIRLYEYITESEIREHMSAHNGYLSLDFVFQKSYFDTIRRKDPTTFAKIQDMSLEELAEYYYDRERADTFDQFGEQLAANKRTEITQSPVYWKEALEDTFYTLNFYARYLCAVDMRRLRKFLVPLLHHAVGFLPFESSNEMMALYRAGKLENVRIGYSGSYTPPTKTSLGEVRYIDNNGDLHTDSYEMLIECRGQTHLSFDQFPFQSLVRDGVINRAFVRCGVKDKHLSNSHNNLENCELRDFEGEQRLYLPGIHFDSQFRPIDQLGNTQPNLWIFANPFLKGMNPDLSGMPFFCDASIQVAKSIANLFSKPN